jgi:hypothetical protein
MTTGFALSEKMMPYIRKSIAEIPAGCFFNIIDAPIERDLHEATDLVLKLSGGDIAVRVRNFKYKYFNDNKPFAFDWSVRCQTRYGGRTEIHKLREGFARWYFMSIANYEETDLFDYGLIDLDKCRSIDLFCDEIWRPNINPNGDGTAGGYLSMRTVQEYGCILWSPNPKNIYQKNKEIPCQTYSET